MSERATDLPRTSSLPKFSVQPTFERLAKLAELEPDWDSYGADEPTTKALTRAYGLVAIIAEEYADRADELALPWAIAPLADGGVQLEWRGPRGAVEIEIGPRGDYGYVLEEGQKGDVTYRQADDVATAQVRDLVAYVLGQ